MLKIIFIVLLIGSTVLLPTAANAQTRSTRAAQGGVATTRIVREIRHELLTLPYYGIFDWLEGEVRPDGTVVLRGQVVQPTTKSDAIARVKDIEGVTRVEDQIEVLPLSPNDDQIRRAVYRALFNFDSPLFQYAMRSNAPIHIIVKNGNVTLKGVVANKTDSDLANIRARSVPGVFSVTNDLQIENEKVR